MTTPERPDPGLGPVARRLAADQRVLCVEDEVDIADFLRAYFRASGYDLVHLDPDSPHAVVDAVLEHEPDCVLLDLRLRGFNGYDAYRLLRADDRFAFIPIIVVSAQDLPEPVMGGLDRYVSKPFNSNTLAGVVKEVIERADELAKEGRNDDLGVMSEAYLRARLIDEVVAGEENQSSCSFALVQLRSLTAMTQTIGAATATKVVSDLLATMRSMLPADVVMGLTGEAELAIVLPATDVRRTESILADALEEVSGTHVMPGGAEVPVDLAAGLAGYPEHAADADELYMAADGALTDACEGNQLLVVAL